MTTKMDEIQISGAGEEVMGDDFYEKIEAPKFVDLTAPDRYRSQSDARYWFCLRVGCDQKHEEEMDSEAIYKNFVLRVMAARSPSVRLRKALSRKDSSSNLQCPRTVPAKSSKSSVSRLAMISSISQKMGDAKVKVRPVTKQSSTTPNVKAEKQSSTKALTTTRNKKGIINPGNFRSLRNPKPTEIEVPKNRGVAKALVFQSPKKAVKLKKSVELSSSLRKMCAGMKKIEITKNKTLGCNKPLDASTKESRGRGVKIRVYDSLHSQNQKQEAKSLTCLKKKKEKVLQLSKGPMCHKPNEEDSTEMEVEAKSEDGSLEVCSTSGISKNPSESLEQAIDEKVKFSSDTTRNNMTTLSNSEWMNSGEDDVPKSQNGRHGENNERVGHEENIEPCFKDKDIAEATESDDREMALASHIEVSQSKVMEIDDKENESASDQNRKLNCTTVKLVKNDVLGKHEASKSIQKVTKVMNKTLKESSRSSVNGAQRMKYRKPKFTNPKPFRLRTDERGILKEANLEKKHLQAPSKETTFPGSQGGNSRTKHQNVQINEKCLGKIETVNSRHEGTDLESDTSTLKDQPQTIKICSSRISKGTMERKLSTTPQKRTVPMHQKTKFPSLLEKVQHKAAQKSEGRLEKTKLPSIKKLVRTRGVASSRKKLVSVMKHDQLGVIKEMSATMSRRKETSDPNESETSLTTKASASNASRPSPKGRRHTTIPKEPNFHSFHVPKSCTRRV